MSRDGSVFLASISFLISRYLWLAAWLFFLLSNDCQDITDSIAFFLAWSLLIYSFSFSLRLSVELCLGLSS